MGLSPGFHFLWRKGPESSRICQATSSKQSRADMQLVQLIIKRAFYDKCTHLLMNHRWRSLNNVFSKTATDSRKKAWVSSRFTVPSCPISHRRLSCLHQVKASDTSTHAPNEHRRTAVWPRWRIVHHNQINSFVYIYVVKSVWTRRRCFLSKVGEHLKVNTTSSVKFSGKRYISSIFSFLSALWAFFKHSALPKKKKKSSSKMASDDRIHFLSQHKQKN